MSEPARNQSPFETAGRPSATPGPLRDWLAAMRATAPEPRMLESEPTQPAAPAAEAKPNGWAPRLVVPAPKAEEQDDEVAELIAENMMLKAKLRLESDRRDDLQLLLAQEVRELRAHIKDEIALIEDMRAERDLWKARCEALMQPLFNGPQIR